MLILGNLPFAKFKYVDITVEILFCRPKALNSEISTPNLLKFYTDITDR